MTGTCGFSRTPRIPYRDGGAVAAAKYGFPVFFVRLVARPDRLRCPRNRSAGVPACIFVIERQRRECRRDACATEDPKLAICWQASGSAIQPSPGDR